MPNIFDDDERNFVALVNQEKQYSLWPVDLNVPTGWTLMYGPDTRAAVLKRIEQQWTDMRPASLVNTLDATDNIR